MLKEDKHRDHVKILFELERDDGARDIESVWAIPTADGFRIDNIPFYAREVAWGDVVSAAADGDGLLRYSGLICPSGHSTVRLWFASEADVPAVRNALRDLGCSSELDLTRLVAVDIPPTTAYEVVRSYLEGLELAGVCEYEEACLGQG